MKQLPAARPSQGGSMAETVLGTDIGKRKFEVHRLVNGKTKSKSVSNSKEGFLVLSQWLSKHKAGIVHACMEATGSYGDELALSLHDSDHNVSIVNPARIKGLAQRALT